MLLSIKSPGRRRGAPLLVFMSTLCLISKGESLRESKYRASYLCRWGVFLCIIYCWGLTLIVCVFCWAYRGRYVLSLLRLCRSSCVLAAKQTVLNDAVESLNSTFLLNLLCVNLQIMWILAIRVRLRKRGGVVGWCESKFWNDSAAFVWKKTLSQCSSSLWRPPIEKLLVISSCLLDYWIMSCSFSCCLLQAPSSVWAPSGLCFSLLPARQSVNYRRPSGSRFARKTHFSSPQSFPVQCVLLSFFFFLLLSIWNSGQLRMYSTTVNHSTFQPWQRWGKIHLKYIYIFPLKTYCRCCSNRHREERKNTTL